MGFLSDLERVREILRRHRRLSVRALARELGIADTDLVELIDELVDIQRVARRDGKAVEWLGDPATPPAAVPASTPGARDYTPRHLADRILASRAAMEGERKQVSVLFCDVVESMALAEALGPEAWHRVLDGFFEVLTAAVHGHDGTVNQYTGDGIMALFGAPLAAEDHARRACAAALEIRCGLASLRDDVSERCHRRFAIRIGINTGEVVVGKIGDDLRMDYTAQGHVVGIAARLESLAQPGQILVSAHTAKQVEGFFELAPAGPQRIKGVSAPLDVFRLDAALAHRTHLDIARARGFSKFVGRDAEMAVLKQAFRRAQAGHGQVVGIVAPPGTGKSRLCWEFRQYCENQPDTLIVPTSARQHQHKVPHAANNQVMAFIYGFADDDTAEQRRAKIRARNLSWDPRSEASLPLAYEFAGVADPAHPPPAMTPEARRRWQMDAVAWAVRQLSQAQTVVFINEDMQWCDPPSLRIAALWMQKAALGRIMMLWNARPEFQPIWDTHEPHMQQVSLQPLDDEAVAQMLATSLGQHPSLAGLGERIMRASGGNPFFCEEILRSLVEQGDLAGPAGARTLARPLADLPLPASVHGVLAARIDRLDEADKQLLQAAAVIGHEFDVATLGALSGADDAALDPALERLRKAEFVEARHSNRYVFKHALTLDVAYGSLLQERRRALHRRIASWMEQRGCADDTALMQLAHHWEDAGELRRAALCVHQAARAVVNRDVKESLRLRREFLRLEAAQPPDPALVPGGIASRKALIEWSGIDPLTRAQAQALFAEGRQLAEAHDDRFRLGALCLAYAMRLQNEGRFTEAIELVEQVAAQADDFDHPALHLSLDAVYRGCFYATAGLVEPALEATRRALELLKRHPELTMLGGANQAASAHTWRGLALGFAGRMDEARASLAWVVENTSEHDLFSIFSDCWTLYLNMLTGTASGADRSLARLERALQNDLGGPWWTCGCYGWAGMGYLQTGNLTRARDYLQRSLSMGHENDGLDTIHFGTRPWLAHVHARLGQHEAAWRLIAENEAPAQQCGSPNFLAAHYWIKCRLLRECDGRAAAERLDECLDGLQAAAERGGMIGYRHLWAWETAQVAALRGDRARCHEALAQALESAERCGAHGHAARIRAQLAEVAVPFAARSAD